MNRNIIASDINNNFLRKLVICIIVVAQVCILVKVSKYASAHPKSKEESIAFRHSRTSVDFEFDEESFLQTKQKINEEILSDYNQDPKEAFQNLRHKLSREEKNIMLIHKKIDSLKTLFVPSQGLSFISQLTNGFLKPISGRSKRSLMGIHECPPEPSNLLGDIFIQQENIPDLLPESTDFSKWYGPLRDGGIFEKSECKAKQRVAIIIPFRDREEHLGIWLYNMHPILQRQQIDYQIFVIEQKDSNKFNRGALMNVGYKESESSDDMDFNCFIFQDVDLIPENDRNLYTCMDGHQVKHLAVAVSKWKYKLIYNSYFGGVSALSKEQYNRINGFANRFYGWGGEDDDFYRRISRQNLTIFRYPGHRSRYTMLKHNFVESDEEVVSEMTKESEMGHLHDDGLSNLKYIKRKEERLPLYTRISVELPNPPKMKKKPKSLLGSGAVFLLNGLNNIVNNVAKKIMIPKVEEGEDVIYP